MYPFLLWMFRNRQTGAITVAQAPNLLLWAVVAALTGRWLVHPADREAAVLDGVIHGGLALWALDEIARGVNPWRRGLGAGVLCYGLARALR